ncbi:MAG TPA: Os1348 family NHLP clan protein [Ktedonobacteraceae bacterium]|nr:Os1348 family NHLP clan protein [Ktedonobacteraceae bacterium]
MSWQTINKVLGLAMIDETFANILLKEPRQALSTYGIQLPEEELQVLCSCKAESLEEFSRQLIEKSGHEPYGSQ